MLTIDDLTVAYGSVLAVDRVSLTVPDGEVLCLLGPSGCGKSTLLRAAAGLEPFRSGRISWDGLDLRNVPVHRRRFGLMFQSGVLFPHLNVAGNIGYGLRTDSRRRGRSWLRGRVAELLELVGMSGFEQRPISTLSGGQAQRVALARALAPKPRLLLLDEPLAALDTELRERLVETLQTVLRATATTAIYVTHDQREAFAVADTVALMHAGVIRQSGPPPLVWAHPLSESVARFVGFSTVVDREVLTPAGFDDAALIRFGTAKRIALRPKALMLDPNGPIHGVCLGSSPSPEALRLHLRIPGVGNVDGVAPIDASIRPGEQVRLTFDPAAAAGVPPDDDREPPRR